MKKKMRRKISKSRLPAIVNIFGNQFYLNVYVKINKPLLYQVST